MNCYLFRKLIKNEIQKKMKHETVLSWKGKMAFESEIDGHKIKLDVPTESGGDESGFRPKKLMLISLAGCTGMDVVSILRKMKVELADFDVAVEANLTDEEPKHYDKMHIVYRFKGANLPIEKLERAVSLSQEKYCGVSATLKKAV